MTFRIHSIPGTCMQASSVSAQHAEAASNKVLEVTVLLVVAALHHCHPSSTAPPVVVTCETLSPGSLSHRAAAATAQERPEVQLRLATYPRMAGSDSDSLDDMLLQAGGAGKASNKRSRSEDVFDDSDQDEAASDFSEEVSQAVQPRGPKPAAKRSKTADASSSKPDPNVPFNEDAFMFDGYGKSLVRDEADAERLDAMNELDREMELSSRADLRDKELERMRNARLLLQAKTARAKQTEAAPPQVLQHDSRVS